MRRVVIRCDGGTDIGMGHVVRCVALAEMLRESFQLLFILQETSDSVYTFLEENTISFATIPRTKIYDEEAKAFVKLLAANDIVVLDGYDFKTDYQKTIKNAGHKLVVIDDLHAWHHVADVIINHASGVIPSDYDCEKNTHLCLGHSYVLLRKAFLNSEYPVRKILGVHRCLISMGAADVMNLTQKFAELLIVHPTLQQISLLVSEVNPHLPALEKWQKSHADKIVLLKNLSAENLAAEIRQTDVVICPASSISLEACAIGVGLMTGYTAENQKGNLTGLTKYDVGNNVGDLIRFVEQPDNILWDKICDVDCINHQIENQRRFIDSGSPIRILQLFRTLTK